MFDATDQEIARREHAAEMGEDSPADKRWSAFYDAAEDEIIARGWDLTFTGGRKAGQSRGLDGADAEDGYSIDSAYDAFEAGRTVAQYIEQVVAKRRALGLGEG